MITQWHPGLLGRLPSDCSPYATRSHILPGRANDARGGVEFVNRHGNPYVADD
jgi:hypothetical protein